MFNKNIIAFSLLLLTACTQSTNADKTASGVLTQQASEASSVADVNNEINFRNHIRQNILEKIQEEAATGKISPEQLNSLLKNKEAINEWVEQVNKTLNQSIDRKAEKLANERMDDFNKILENGTKESKPVDRETLPPLGKEIYDRIKANMPAAIINHIMPLGSDQLYFLVHLNNTTMPMITQKDAEYYVSPTDLQKDGTARFWDKTGKEITDEGKQAVVYKKMLDTVMIDKALKNKIPFKQWGKFNSNRVMYMLVDPDCNYCRDQHEEFANNLKDTDNVRIYYIFNPLPIHPNAADKAGKLLCTDDVSASWNRYVERSVSNGAFPTVDGGKKYDEKTCQFLVSEHRKYSSIFNLGTTPTIITASGKRYIGVQSWKEIKKQNNW